MNEKLLTKVELELMTILWKLKEGSVNDVMAHLPKDRDLAYTSISTILRILEQKKILATRKEGRGHQRTRASPTQPLRRATTRVKNACKKALIKPVRAARGLSSAFG